MASMLCVSTSTALQTDQLDIGNVTRDDLDVVTKRHILESGLLRNNFPITEGKEEKKSFQGNRLKKNSRKWIFFPEKLSSFVNP